MLLPNQQLAALLGTVAALLSGLGTGGVNGEKEMGLMGYFVVEMVWRSFLHHRAATSSLATSNTKIRNADVEISDHLFVWESHQEILDDVADPERYQYDFSHRAVDIVALIMFAVVFRIIAYALMRVMNRDKQK